MFFKKSKRKLLLFICLAFVFVIIIVGIGGWIYKLKQRSLGYAITNINKAVEEADLMLLSKYVDFGLLSKAFVQSILQNWPQVSIDDERKKELENTIQQVILTNFKGTNVTEHAEERKKGDMLSSVLEGEGTLGIRFLPDDFFTQLKGQKLSVHRQDSTMAILVVPIMHKEAGYTVDLKLLAEQLEDGWYVTKVINGYDIVKMHMQAIDAKISAIRDKKELDNSNIKEQMDKYYHVSSCKAFVSDAMHDGAVSFFVVIEGANTGEETVTSAAMQCFVRDRDGHIVAVLPLDTMKRIQPKETFNQKWVFDVVKEENVETALLFKEKELFCSTELIRLTLINGMFFRLTPDKDEKRIHP